jgi:hypothetical protein
MSSVVGILSDEPEQEEVEEEAPQFSLAELSLDATEMAKYGGIKSMSCGSDILIFGTAKGRVFVYNLETETPSFYDIVRKSTEEVYKVFCDPTGSHVLVCMDNCDLYYAHTSFSRPRKLEKARSRSGKGFLVEAVAWDKTNRDTSATGSVLLASEDGCVYEIVLNTKDTMKNFRLLAEVTEGRPIQGIVYEQHEKQKTFSAVVATSNRLYTFTNKPSLEELFSRDGITELPSDLEFAHLTQSKKWVAWLTGAGVYHFVYSNGTASETCLFQYEPTLKVSPLAVALCEYHILVLYTDRVCAYLSPPGKSDKNEKPVKVAEFPVKNALSIMRDPATGSIFLCSDKRAYEVTVVDEGRNVWKVFLERKQWDLATRYAKTDEQLAIIHETRANSLYASGEIEDAARIWARTNSGFEEIALKLLKHEKALRMFLTEKLRIMKNQQGSETQRTCIGTWLLEIHLNAIQRKGSEKPEERDRAVEEFRAFLTDHADILNKHTTTSMILSYGYLDELIFYCQQVGDYEKIVSHYVSYAQYKRALGVLSKLKDSAEHVHLFYRYTSVLLENCPAEMVEVLIKSSTVQPAQIINVLVATNHPESTKYLEHVVYVRRSKDASVHNFLFRKLLEREDDSANKYLESSYNHVDLKYALRLSIERSRQHEQIIIYSLMGLFENAMTTALQLGDVELAIENAERVEDLVLKKKLYLQVAKHVVSVKKDIRDAMALIHRCGLIKIEDVLPFFPDFALIDDFKDEICASLEEYNEEIGALREEMNEAMQMAELIRTDIRELRGRHGYVSASQKCAFSGQMLNGRAFVLFPCGHAFLEDVLVQEVAKRNRVVRTRASAGDKKEVDEMVARECPLCGEMMIRLTDEPFISLDEVSVESSWSVM